MKFNVAYVKQHPAMFGVIFVVFGLLLYVLINRGGSAASSGSTVVTNSGPSPAELAAATQVQLAQIGAGAAGQQAQYQLAAIQYQGDTQIALGGLAANIQLAQAASDERVAKYTTDASVEALHAQLDNSLATTQSNNQFMVDYARNATDAANTQLLIGASLQRDLSAQQLEAYKIGVGANIVSLAYARASINKNNTASLNAATDLARRLMSSTGTGG